MAIEEHTVEMQDGARLNVRCLGSENTDKPLIIATHGGPGMVDHVESENSFGFLSSHFRVIVYDMRGSGKSSDQGPFSHEQFVADVEQLRIWAGEEKIFAAGASYGGFVSMEYTLKHPERVTCLLLRNTTALGIRLLMNSAKSMFTDPRVQSDHDRTMRNLTGTPRDLEDMIEFFADVGVVYKPEFTATGERRPSAERVKMTPEQFHDKTWQYVITNNLRSYDIRSRLPEIAVPTKIVGGRQDFVTSVVDVEEIASLIPDCDLTILEGAGHNLADDERELWYQTLREFLEARGFLQAA
ncbi:alpha/beta hydrolase fold domain-containing protein [Sarocladium implicatum]|nr:alpha/beta hydrolase fold domain-containing protein [Sarocladium implicatum]